MNRSHTAHSPYSLAPTERIPSYPGYSDPPAEDLDYEYPGEQEPEEYRDYDDDYDDYEQRFDEERIDRRWMWVAGIAGAILFIAIGTTGIILGGGDSGSVSATATSEAPAPSSAPATTSAPRAAGTSAPIVPSLPPETVTTVSPTAEVTPPPSTTPPAAVPPPPPPSPRTFTYRVTGNRQLLDLVTVIYTDGQGALRTDVNVALPWVKQVILDPGVELKSVTATSVAGQLNCSILDAAGTLIAAQNNNSMIATCTR
ncbi:hypothetical protein QGN32_05360 [Mycolicibacterium sp. ND9-15]|uniref:hypothetical protein n=1 Tax=Mycolicibacterium sp. ND9-15 TaxID=3042320 RepID=UPI002DD896A2|nr:hypothetical protein [Mycolicibacterium sp. ND9-15]WSE57326.1 hypothetical protein QGN32_05360 [Mycolicibacterium sp. ND9-15]